METRQVLKYLVPSLTIGVLFIFFIVLLNYSFNTFDNKENYLFKMFIFLFFIVLIIFILLMVYINIPEVCSEKVCPEKICSETDCNKFSKTCPPEKVCPVCETTTSDNSLCPVCSDCNSPQQNLSQTSQQNLSQTSQQNLSQTSQTSTKKEFIPSKEPIIKKTNLNYEMIDNYVSVYSLWTEVDNPDDIIFPEFNGQPIGFITEDILELINIVSKDNNNKLWDKQIVLNIKTDFEVLKSIFKMIDQNYNDDVNKNVLIVTMDIINNKKIPKKVIMIYDEKSFVGYNKLSVKEYNSLEKSIYNMNYQLWVPYERRFKYSS